MLMRALKSFSYAGRRIQPGEEFETRKDIDARLLAAGKRAVKVDAGDRVATPPRRAVAAKIEPPLTEPPVAPQGADASGPADKRDPPPSIPDGWRELPWVVAREPGGPTLRGLASAFSEQPVRSKDDATAAIEAEIRKRAGNA